MENKKGYLISEDQFNTIYNFAKGLKSDKKIEPVIIKDTIDMKIIKYDKLIELINKAVELHQEVLQTDVSYSFRTYLENRNTDELHIYYYDSI